MNIFSAYFKVSQWVSAFAPTQGLPWCSGTECCKNIDPAAAPMITTKDASWTSALLVPMLRSRRAAAALAHFCGACL
jgi:hypothetical protein